MSRSAEGAWTHLWKSSCCGGLHSNFPLHQVPGRMMNSNMVSSWSVLLSWSKSMGPPLLTQSPTLALTSTQHCAPPRSNCGSTLFSSLGSTSIGPLPSSPSGSQPGSQSPLSSLQGRIWGPSKEQQIWGKWAHHLRFLCLPSFILLWLLQDGAQVWAHRWQPPPGDPRLLWNSPTSHTSHFET